jgi:hypothetical protein
VETLSALFLPSAVHSHKGAIVVPFVPSLLVVAGARVVESNQKVREMLRVPKERNIDRTIKKSQSRKMRKFCVSNDPVERAVKAMRALSFLPIAIVLVAAHIGLIPLVCSPAPFVGSQS